MEMLSGIDLKQKKMKKKILKKYGNKNIPGIGEIK